VVLTFKMHGLLVILLEKQSLNQTIEFYHNKFIISIFISLAKSTLNKRILLKNITKL